jgi:hypothetical protein
MKRSFEGEENIKIKKSKGSPIDITDLNELEKIKETKIQTIIDYKFNEKKLMSKIIEIIKRNKIEIDLIDLNLLFLTTKDLLFIKLLIKEEIPINTLRFSKNSVQEMEDFNKILKYLCSVKIIENLEFFGLFFILIKYKEMDVFNYVTLNNIIQLLQDSSYKTINLQNNKEIRNKPLNISFQIAKQIIEKNKHNKLLIDQICNKNINK